MRLAGNLLVALSLIAGVLSAATAYQVSLDHGNEVYEGLVLTAAAGLRLDQDGKPVLSDKGAPEPLLVLGSPLTSDNLKKLRANQKALAANPPEIPGYRVPNGKIRVQKFSFARWDQSWIFACSVGGMILGAGLVRTAASRQATVHRESGKSEDLLKALRDARQRLSQLQQHLDSAGDKIAELPHVVDDLSQLAGDLQVNFLDHLEVIRSLLSTGKMAEVMESYAVAERFSNRARSTAVDQDPYESERCLAAAAERMSHTIELLEQSR